MLCSITIRNSDKNVSLHLKFKIMDIGLIQNTKSQSFDGIILGTALKEFIKFDS